MDKRYREDSDTIYNNQFLENCIVFCLTTL